MPDYSTFNYSQGDYIIFGKIDYDMIYFTISNKTNHNDIFTGSVYLVDVGLLHKIISAFVYNKYTIAEKDNKLIMLFNFYDNTTLDVEFVTNLIY